MLDTLKKTPETREHELEEYKQRQMCVRIYIHTYTFLVTVNARNCARIRAHAQKFPFRAPSQFLCLSLSVFLSPRHYYFLSVAHTTAASKIRGHLLDRGDSTMWTTWRLAGACLSLICSFSAAIALMAASREMYLSPPK